MRAFGHTELTTAELQDELQFRVVRHISQRDWINRFTEQLVTLLPTLGICLLYGFWRGRGALWVVAGVAVGTFFGQIVVLLAYLLRGPATELRVTSVGLVATGNFGGNIFSNRIVVPWSKIKLLGWAERGLCAVQNGFPGFIPCVLPGLNEGEAKTVRTAICNRFPAIALKVLPRSAVSEDAEALQWNSDARQ